MTGCRRDAWLGEVLSLVLMTSHENGLPPQGEAGTPSAHAPQDRALLQSRAFWSVADRLDLDVKQRRFIWPVDRRMTLQESAEHIRRQQPQLSAELVESFLIAHIENYAPEECTKEELEEIDRFAAQWLDEVENSEQVP